LGLRNQSSDKLQTTDAVAAGQGEKGAAHARQEAVNTMMASGGKNGVRSPEPKTIDLTANPYEQAKAQTQTT
jgi:hypothetical protein